MTYAITVCDEYAELDRLLNILSYFTDIKKYVYVQCDEINVTSDVHNVISKYRVRHGSEILNGHFADFKNNIYKHCDTQWIFFIDADEYPHMALLENMEIIMCSQVVDVIAVPRINTVDGLTDAHINTWGWRVDTMSVGNEMVSAVNFPDYQWRIQKNIPVIKWINPVHEILSGFETFGKFPPEVEYCLMHPKNIEKQVKQNLLYDKLTSRI